MSANTWRALDAPDSDRGPVRRWITECVDRIAQWCEFSSGAWATVEAPAVATAMRDAVVVAAITEFGSPGGPNVAAGGWL
ncbi:hypothetical protein [Nocardia nepalensis]|uniref:hypothetical protein n=1 Tax=Nocardia nepalensis TaxID=3375448 RepID=UPI003B686180